MTRRRSVLLAPLGIALPGWVAAQPLSDAEAASGMRAALERACVLATNSLGRTDAFMGNPKLRVPLPRALDDAAQMLLANGQRRPVGELLTAMNRAAESAMPEARTMLVDAARLLNVVDAAKVLTAGDRAATEYFEHHARSVIAEQFLPILRGRADRVRLAQKYDAFVSSASPLGLLASQDADLPRYVARKALDSVFVVIGDQEARFRMDPTSTGSAALQRLFRAIK
jgi:Protein of unknown function (DUF4197)